MRNNYSNLICLTLLSIVTLIGRVAFGQNKIKVEEFPNLAKKITNVVPEGKALFVFEAKEDYQFDSDNENIVQPIKEGLLYRLYFSVETSSGAITILNKVADKATINYGRDLFENSLPALNSGEIRYFKLSLEPMFLKPKLEFADVTRQKKTEGAADLPTYNLRDALIIFNVVPKDLKIKIEGKKIDTVFKDVTGVYKVYVQPEDQVLVLKSENYTDESVPIGNLNTKEVRYYYVQQPISDKGIESFDPNVKIGSYSIESNPPGAIIQMLGQPDFNKQQYKTPYPLEGYKSGTEIITLSLNRYETITDTILISSSKGKRSKYNLTPRFAFINCNIEPPIPIAKVMMDGKELTMIKNSENFECPKGIHTFEIVAPHYYTETRQINLAAGKTGEFNIILKKKMGSFTVLPGENAVNAEVYVDEKNIGKLPIENYKLQEGEHKIRFTKKGFVTKEDNYDLIIKENNLTIFNNVKMINIREIRIISEPISNATVYIDGKETGSTPLSVKLPVGKYKVTIKKKNFEDFTETIDLQAESSTYTYKLKPIFNISVDSRPSSASVFLDNVSQGITPIKITAPIGNHTITIGKESYFTRKIKVDATDVPQKISKVLRTSELIGVGFSMGNQGLPGGIEGLYAWGKFELSLGYHKAEPLIPIANYDSTASSFSFQVGYRNIYPFDFILHGGLNMRSFGYDDGTSSGGYGSTDSKGNKKRYFSPLLGVRLPIYLSRKIGVYLNTEYQPMSEKDGIIIVSAGLIGSIGAK